MSFIVITLFNLDKTYYENITLIVSCADGTFRPRTMPYNCKTKNTTLSKQFQYRKVAKKTEAARSSWFLFSQFLLWNQWANCPIMISLMDGCCLLGSYYTNGSWWLRWSNQFENCTVVATTSVWNICVKNIIIIKTYSANIFWCSCSIKHLIYLAFNFCALNVSDDGYSRNMSLVLNVIATFFGPRICSLYRNHNTVLLTYSVFAKDIL
jgi:hypothetical protein